MAVRTPTVNRESRWPPPKLSSTATLPPSEFAIDSQLFGGWERRFTTLAGAIHKFEGSIHNLIHNFWQGNGQ